MKTCLWLSFLLFIDLHTVVTANAQTNMGTIDVNENCTATLHFNSNVDFLTIGNNPQIGETTSGSPVFKYFDIFQSGKTVFLRGKDPAAPKTSITIKLENEEICFGMLQYGQNARIYYDFTGTTNPEHKDSLNQKAKNEQVMIQTMDRVLALSNDYIEGVEENLLEVVVSNIRNDDRYTYFKISIRNESGNDYIIDNATFKYVEGKNKGLFKKGSIIEEREQIVYQTDQKIVKANSTAHLGYVIPLFAVGTGGTLKIQFIEKNGTRNPSINLSSRTMLKVKTI